MPTPLTITKLFRPPPRPDAIVHPRLLDQLQAGVYRKLTLLSAPAGFGKTTLVSSWLAIYSHPSAWVSLDAGDHDLAQFLRYLIAAFQTITPTLGQHTLAALHSPQPPTTALLIGMLVNELAAHAEPVILVLDDYHMLDSPAVDAALALLLEGLPAQFHLVITTRLDPALPLARLRARDQLTEIRADDLRFRPAEAAIFLHEVMGLALSEAQVQALETRTEGWAAGLQLAALSLRGRHNLADLVQSFAGNHRYIVDYLVEEVLQQQPAVLQRFLLQTAILERLSGPLCDAVTGQRDGAALLDTLERSNLFVVPLDHQRHWFRYHQLFAEALVAFAQRHEPSQVRVLHQRASRWYAEQGQYGEAIGHALAGQDDIQVAELLELAWPVMDGTFQATTWLAWARPLPAMVLQHRPVLQVAYAWALLNTGELEQAERYLQAAEQDIHMPGYLVIDQHQFRTLPASIATARAYMAQAHGDTPGTVQYAQQALTILANDDYLRRGPAAALLGLAQWASGDLERAYTTLADAMWSFQQAGNLHFALSGTYGLADIRIAQGRLRDATSVYMQALKLVRSHGEPWLHGTAELYLGLSALAHEQGDLATAHQQLQRSEALGETAALADWQYRLCRTKAQFAYSQGNSDEALALLDQAEQHYFRSPVPELQPLAAIRTRIWVAQGRLHEARQWVHTQQLGLHDQLSFLREYEHLTFVRVLLADGASADALLLLERLLQAAQAGQRMSSVIEINLLLALARVAQGDRRAALAALEQALGLAAPEGYVRSIVEHGPAMAQLLADALNRGIQPAYVARLLAAFSLNGTAPTVAVPNAAPAHPLVEPLSMRELEVLQLMADGHSNHEIAKRLFLALSTVKGHNRNIFDKLQVQRRTEAIARARVLGLIP